MEMTTPYKCAICVVFYAFSFVIYYFRHACIKSQKGRAGVVGALLINLYGILLTPDIFQKFFIWVEGFPIGQIFFADGYHP